MQAKKLNRIVLVQPGINAQLTRRILGMGRAMGISICIINDDSTTPEANASDEIAIIFSSLQSPDTTLLQNDVKTNVAICPLFTPTQLKAVTKDAWSSTPISFDSAFIAETIQLISLSTLPSSTRLNMGWQGLSDNHNSNSIELTNDLSKALRRLGLENHSVANSIRAIATKIQKLSHETEIIRLEVNSDGNSLNINWNFKSTTEKNLKLLALLGKNYNSIHTCMNIENGNSSSTCLRSRYFLGSNLQGCAAFILVGQYSLSTAEAEELSDAWEKSA